MKKFLLVLTVILAVPVFASAYTSNTPTDGVIYSINGYGHIGGKSKSSSSSLSGLGGDLGVTIHLMPYSYTTPIIFFSAGAGVLNESLQGDLKLLGGVSWHLTDYFYADLSAGAQGFLYSKENESGESKTKIGGSILADASVMLHFEEVIGIRAGCMISLGTNGLVMSPHIGLSSTIDFSWLFWY